MEPHPAAVEAVGAWLGAMQSIRGQLLHTLTRIDRAGWGNGFLDWRGPAGDDNSVGSLLYHIAAVELSWLYFDMLPEREPDDLRDLLPFDDRDDQGHLVHVTGWTMQQHLDLLAEARRRFLHEVGAMTLEDWRTLRSPPGEDYSATPEWIVFHLVEHEAGHLYGIHRLVRLWREQRGLHAE